MVGTDRLDAYHFYEQDVDSYDDLRAEFEHEVPETFNMASYVCDRWADEDSRVAFRYQNDATDRSRTITFRELRADASRLADYLADQGVERGDRVGVNLPQKPETIVAHLAIWKLGAVSVPLSTLFGPDALEYRLTDSGAIGMLVDAENVGAFREVRDGLDSLGFVVTLGVDEPRPDETVWEDALAGRASERETVETDPDDDAVLIYTSGTTGQPKGVLHAHRVLLGYLPGTVTYLLNMERREEDVAWATTEWSWVGALFLIVLPTMFYGMPNVAYYSPGSFDPEETFDVIEAHDVTLTFLPPTAIRMMRNVEAPKNRFDVGGLRTLLTGGESVGQDIYDWVADVFEGAVIHEAYGQTEHNPAVGDCSALFELKVGPMGRAVVDKTVGIVDPETSEPLDPGEVGEIAYRYEGDPSHFKEYWNKPERTASKRNNGWHLSGDLGVIDEDGYVEFRGRKDHVIMSAGHRIGPQHIEDTLAQHDAVADAGVIGIPDEMRGQVPKAFVVLAEGYEASDALDEELQQYVKERLAKYEYPREIQFIDDLPLTPTGKIQRFKLEDRNE